MADLIRRSDVIGLLEDMLLFGEYDIIASSFSEADEEKAYKAINDIPAVNCWIPCRERMPEHYNEILFCERDRTIHKGYMYWDGTFIEHDVKFKKNDIVAWMPMPEPPKEADND